MSNRAALLDAFMDALNAHVQESITVADSNYEGPCHVYQTSAAVKETLGALLDEVEQRASDATIKHINGHTP